MLADALPEEMLPIILEHCEDTSLMTVARFVNTRWKHLAEHELHRRHWNTIRSQLRSTLFTIHSPKAQLVATIRYLRHLHNYEFPPLPLYACARCMGPCDGIGTCRTCRVSPFPWRKVLTGPVVSLLIACLALTRINPRFSSPPRS